MAREYTPQDVDRLMQVIDDLIKLLPNNNADAAPGRSVTLRNNNGQIEWQREGDAGWASLFTVPSNSDPVNYYNIYKSVRR